MTIVLTTLFGAVLVLAAASAKAEDHLITQENKAFAERRITIAAGDTVTFVNNDSTTHNVHSRSDGNEFDLGAQGPGVSTSHQFMSAGKAKVRCAIHPKMKIDVTVE